MPLHPHYSTVIWGISCGVPEKLRASSVSGQDVQERNTWGLLGCQNVAGRRSLMHYNAEYTWITQTLITSQNCACSTQVVEKWTSQVWRHLTRFTTVSRRTILVFAISHPIQIKQLSVRLHCQSVVSCIIAWFTLVRLDVKSRLWMTNYRRAVNSFWVRASAFRLLSNYHSPGGRFDIGLFLTEKLHFSG